MKKDTKERGITLIALVITIIVLLILAGVAISMLSGENGILNKASEAKTKTEAVQKEEDTIITSTELQMHFTSEGISRYVSYGYITNIQINESASSLLEDLPKEYTIWSTTGDKVEGATPLKTGMIVRDENMKKIAELVIYGDINGDGAVDVTDKLYITNEMNGLKKLEGCYRVAADVNFDGKLDMDDAKIIEGYFGHIEHISIEQNKVAKNPKDIICYTNNELRSKYVNIIKEKFTGTQYTVEYNKENGLYKNVLKGGTTTTTVGDLLDIINEKGIDIRNKNKEILDRETIIYNTSENLYFYYKVTEEEKSEEDINLYFKIDFTA